MPASGTDPGDRGCGAVAIRSRQDGLRGMRQVVAEMCEAMGIELTPERRAQIEAMGKEQLLLLARRIKERRAW